MNPVPFDTSPEPADVPEPADSPSGYLGHCFTCGQAVYDDEQNGEQCCRDHCNAPVVPLEAFEAHEVVIAELVHAQQVIAYKLLGEGVTVTHTHPEIVRIDVVLGRRNG